MRSSHTRKAFLAFPCKPLPMLALVGILGSTPLLAQEAQESPKPSVSPEQVDMSYDPLRNRKVNPIMMIRDMRRRDGASTAEPTEPEVQTLPPATQTTPPPSSVTPNQAPAPAPQTSPAPSGGVSPRDYTPPKHYRPERTSPQVATPVPVPIPAPRTSTPAPAPTPTPAPQVAQPTPAPTPSISIPTPTTSPQPPAVAEVEITEEAVESVELSPETPNGSIANRVDISNNPGFVSFEALPTGEFLDQKDYKDYFEAGWGFLVQSQVDVVEDIANIRSNIEDRDNYLTTGMAMLASQQDTNTIRMNEMEERLTTLEGKAPADDNIYNLSPLDDEEPLMEVVSEDEAEETSEPSEGKAPEIAETEVEEGPSAQELRMMEKEAELDYLITLLDDIIAYPSKYMFWTGYLPEAGPSPLRFAEAPFMVNRRDLIPLTNPEALPLDEDELFAQTDDADLVDDASKKQPTLRPAYEGNIRELSRDQILRMLQGNAEEAQDVRVRFQVPNQTRAKTLNTPGSLELYSTE